jgi:hypothetical protein
METIMNKLILSNIIAVTLSVTASYADVNAESGTDKNAERTEKVALKPDTTDQTKKADPTPVAAPTNGSKGLKDLPSMTDFPISAY